MKLRLLNYLLVALAGTFVFSSCGGGSGGSGSSTGTTGALVNTSVSSTGDATSTDDFSNTNVGEQVTGGSTNPAPFTLDATSLRLTSDSELIFHFARLRGDGTAGSPEEGFANSISTNGGSIGGVDVPTAMRSISYTYVRTGPFTGTLTIVADILTNGIGEIQENPPKPNTDPFDLMIGTGGASEAYYLTFGTDGNVINEIAVEGSNIPVNEQELVVDANGNIIQPLQRVAVSPKPTVSYVFNTPNHQVYLRGQDGSALPAGYSPADAEDAFRVTPSGLYPLDLSQAGRLIIGYADVNGVFRNYFLFGATSSGAGSSQFPSNIAQDEGVYRMDLALNNVVQLANGNQVSVDATYTDNNAVEVNPGDEIDANGDFVNAGPVADVSYDNDVVYIWEPATETADTADLTVAYNTPDGTAVTERFRFTFSSFESGSVSVLQSPYGVGSVGVFEFLDRDDTSGL